MRGSSADAAATAVASPEAGGAARIVVAVVIAAAAQIRVEVKIDDGGGAVVAVDPAHALRPGELARVEVEREVDLVKRARRRGKFAFLR